MQDCTIKRIKEDDDPNRCQNVGSRGQCYNLAVEGGKFCLVHGGNKTIQAQKAKELRNYRLTRNKVRLIELGNSSGIKSLRDEIAILRMLLEEKFNAITNTNEMILESGAISDLVLKIEKIVTSCQRLEEKTGTMLDKAQVMAVADQLIDIVTKHVPDTNIVEAMSLEIANIFDSDAFKVTDE